MPNTYFRFKQFTVHQEACAMKVCTDACVFGAWVAGQAKKSGPAHILDIGTGTGLLSLMLAQATAASIDSIEIDEQAAGQAKQNSLASPWKERLSVLHGDVRTTGTLKSYDLIISNPPFFENDLKSADQQRNLALHSSELGLSGLIDVVEKHLAVNGSFAVLLPYHRKNEMIELAETKHFFLSNNLDLRQSTTHSFFRTMLLFSRQRISPEHAELAIRENNSYTAGFTALLRDYYLHL